MASDTGKNEFCLFRNYMIAESEHPESKVFQVLRSFGVIPPNFFQLVNETIGFNNQVAFVTIEVNNIWAYRMLTTELAALLFSVA
jgi:uncharacterized protein YutE (UPF0331/DUF86 family)